MGKKKIGIFLVFLFIMIALGGILISLEKDNTMDKQLVEIPAVEYTTTIRSEVMKDNITYAIKLVGVVDTYSENGYYEMINIPFENDIEKKSFVCEYAIGDEILKGEKLYLFNGNEYCISYDGRISDILIDDNQGMIKLLNYDKLYVKCMVNYKDIDIFEIGKNVKLKINYGDDYGDEFKGKIVGIGNNVQDNKIDIYIDYDKRILPGANISGEYICEKDVKTMYVLKNMIQSNGIENFVQVLDKEGKKTDVIVELGEEFTVENEGVIQEYVEIFGDVNEGDKLTVEVFTE